MSGLPVRNVPLWLSLWVSWSKLGVADTDHISEIEGRNVPAIFYLSQAPLFPCHVMAPCLCLIALLYKPYLASGCEYLLCACLALTSRVTKPGWTECYGFFRATSLLNTPYLTRASGPFKATPLSRLDPKLTIHAILGNPQENSGELSAKVKEGFHELTGRLTAYRFREYSGMHRK